MGCTLLFLGAACSTPTPAATPTRQAIFAPQSSVSPSATPAPPPPAPSPPTLPPRPTATTFCADNASFIEDLSIPDGSQVLPGAALDKRWSVRNSGSCDWGPDYRLVQVGTSEIQGPAEVALYPARAGSTAVWQVALVAPAAPGEYLGRWQARAPDGTLFGDEVFVLIVVELPTPTPSPAPTATP